ncbi:MAG: hypothetical protein V5A88_09680 [Candidatus Thermoplasmatota archaeon]
MPRCEICGKPTTSHSLGEYVVCHSCWENNPDELEELKKEIKRKENEIKEIKESGEKISRELKDAGSTEEVKSLIHEYQKNLNLADEKNLEDYTFTKIIEDACEPLSNEVFQIAKKEGWSFLLNLIERYPPEDTPDPMPIVNAVSRYLILTRWKEGIEKIPVEALDYLTNFDEGMDEMWEDSFTCGWGFDHPEFDFVGALRSAIEKGQIFWAVGSLEQVFYFEQKKAADILIDFLRSDDLTEDEKSSLVQSVALIGHREWETSEIIPHYWDWKESVGYEGFEWNEKIKSDLREVIEDELEERMSKMVGEWDFYDLGWK